MRRISLDHCTKRPDDVDDPIRSDPIRSDPIRSDPIRSDPIRSDPIRSDPSLDKLSDDSKNEGSFSCVTQRSDITSVSYGSL
ncbi:hypothetical protein C8233_04690 [Halomonas sp. SF2003]|nr:hypothetical protein C8233_04690 [Halomonas sp. SF2003]